jgi:pilus biogenesis lipoprotein CpaD
MKTNRLTFLMGAMAIALMVSACDPTTPSEIGTTKIQVKDRVITEMLVTDHVDKTAVQAIAANVLHGGENVDVTLTVPYLPGGYAGAAKLGSAYKKAFSAQGVTHFSVALVQMTDSRDTGKAVVSYQKMAASAPDDCKRLPGYQGSGTLEDAQGYHYGCENQANLSKMIADPSDLLGKEPNITADSQRTGLYVDTYAQAKPTQQLKGMSASGK